MEFKRHRSFSLRNRAVIIVATVLLLFLGVRAARLPIDAVPDVTNVQVQVITASPRFRPRKSSST